MYCQHCGRKSESKPSHIQHSIRCNRNPDRIEPSYGMLGKKGGNQYTKSKRLGVEWIITDENRENLRKSQIGFKWSEERKAKHRETMRKAVLEHPESYSSSNVSGRTKNFQFGGMTLKGSWELKVAKVLAEANVSFTNIVSPVEYQWNGGNHLYFPDFYLKDFNLYLEVKGYKRDRDSCKWAAVPNLIVVDSATIDNIDSTNILSFIENYWAQGLECGSAGPDS